MPGQERDDLPTDLQIRHVNVIRSKHSRSNTTCPSRMSFTVTGRVIAIASDHQYPCDEAVT
jgi:hypothetical protein